MGRPSVNALASDAEVTAVGGTLLDPAFDAGGNATGYASEAVWNDADGASGGGVSAQVAKPAYQNGPGVPADGFRDLPDVALLASPSGSGYIVVVENGLAIVGGTSAGTPNWAGIVALLNDAIHADGLGPLNPLLYDLARSQFGGGGTAVFHDVTSGDTTFDRVSGFSATAGFDLATGWGSPDTERLVQAVQQAVASPTPSPTAPEPPTAPPSPCVGDCQGARAVDVGDLVTLVDIALGGLPLSACTAGDANGDGMITVAEIVTAVHAAADGCPP
jgi:kumamolisin